VPVACQTHFFLPLQSGGPTDPAKSAFGHPSEHSRPRLAASSAFLRKIYACFRYRDTTWRIYPARWFVDTAGRRNQRVVGFPSRAIPPVQPHIRASKRPDPANCAEQRTTSAIRLIPFRVAVNFGGHPSEPQLKQIQRNCFFGANRAPVGQTCSSANSNALQAFPCRHGGRARPRLQDDRGVQLFSCAPGPMPLDRNASSAGRTNCRKGKGIIARWRG